MLLGSLILHLTEISVHGCVSHAFLACIFRPARCGCRVPTRTKSTIAAGRQYARVGDG